MVGQFARTRGLPFADDLFSFAQGVGLTVGFTVEFVAGDASDQWKGMKS